MRRILTLARSIAGKAVSNLPIEAASGVSRASGPYRRCCRCVVLPARLKTCKNRLEPQMNSHERG